MRLQQVSHAPAPLSSCSTEIELVTNDSGQTGTGSCKVQLVTCACASCLSFARQIEITRLVSKTVAVKTTSCGFLLLNRPSFRSRFPSSASQVSSRSSTAEANSSISRSKAAVKSVSSSPDSSSSELGSSSVSRGPCNALTSRHEVCENRFLNRSFGFRSDT